MTKLELLTKIQSLQCADSTEVVLIQTDDESAYNTVNTVELRTLTFGSDDVPKEEWADETCLVISDEF